MLKVVAPMGCEDGMLESRVDSFEGWARLPMEVEGSTLNMEHLPLFLGDQTSGPLIWLMAYPPIPSRFWSGQPGGLAHSHRSDSFRIEVDARPEAFFKMGPEQIHFGDYYLLPANTIYTDPPGPDGVTQMLFFADRRGLPGIKKHNRSLDMEALLQGDGVDSLLGGNLSVAHTDDEDCVSRLASTLLESIPARGFSGSVFDHSSWATLSDGSSLHALLMDDPVTGPLVLLSENTPGAFEAPSGRYASDMLRLLLRGTCTVGDRTYQAFEFVAVEAEVEQGAVTHGPEGSTQLLFFADRRGWRPAGRDSECLRLDDLSAVLAPLFSTLEDTRKDGRLTVDPS